LKRLPRILFNALAVLSLLLFVTTVVLWARSYSGTDEFGHLWKTGGVGLMSPTGELHFYRGRWPGDTRGVPVGFRYSRNPKFSTSAQMGAPTHRWGPLRVWRSASAPYAYYALPAWLLAVLFAALPVVRLIRYRRERRNRRHASICPACGYDLRATPDRCPECGTIPSR
jgi:hypothetical protein